MLNALNTVLSIIHLRPRAESCRHKSEARKLSPQKSAEVPHNASDYCIMRFTWFGDLKEEINRRATSKLLTGYASSSFIAKINLIMIFVLSCLGHETLLNFQTTDLPLFPSQRMCHARTETFGAEVYIDPCN